LFGANNLELKIDKFETNHSTVVIEAKQEVAFKQMALSREDSNP
jgi:hypothetical protein